MRVSNDKETVLKSPFAFHLDGCDEQVTREYLTYSEGSGELLEREKAIYQHLGTHRDILTCLEIKDAGLIFPYMKNGDLRHFLRLHNRQILPSVKFVWIQAALRSIDYTHSKGVLIADISARNFLVTDDLSIVLCDFSGAGIDKCLTMVRPETRYEKVDGEQPLPISLATEIFAVGSLLYEISMGCRPYDDLEDDDVEVLFRDREYPSTNGALFGGVIEECWNGDFDVVAAVLQAVLQEGNPLPSGTQPG